MRCGAAAMPGGYRVRRLLSQSPHGRLYVARAPGGAEVALKELVFALVPEARQLEAFEREARLLREVAHPHIPRFVDFFQEGSGVHTRLYLAQELIQGTSLREVLRERRLREEEALAVARQVLDVLRYLHELSPRIVHRDVKPANLVRRDDGTVFLVDFGAARDLLGSGTAGATLVGTFGYMPPEQLGGTLDASCDLYALGASLLHLLTGKSPEEMLASDLSLDVATHAFLSPRMERFLRKLVARDPAERFRSTLDAQLALESSSGENPPPFNWRRVAAAALALGAVAGALLWGWRQFTGAPASAPPPVVPPLAAAPVKPVLPPAPRWTPEPPLLPDLPPHARWRFDEEPSLTGLARDEQRRFDLSTPPGLRDHGLGGGVLKLGPRVPVEVVRAADGDGPGSPAVLEGLEEGALALWLRRDDPFKTVGRVLGSRSAASGSDTSETALGLFVNGGHLEFCAEGSRCLRPRVRLAPGVFHHVVATWGPRGTRLYIGGQPVAEDPTPIQASRQGQTLWIGMSAKSPPETEPPQVSLEDLTLYRGVLAEEAVAKLASLRQGSPDVASDSGPEPLFSEDFSRGLRRWSRQEPPRPVRQESGIVELEGNLLLRLSHQAPRGEPGFFLQATPPRHAVSRASRLWLEADVKLTRLKSARVRRGAPRDGSRQGAGLLLQVVLDMESDSEPRTVLVDLGSRPARSSPTDGPRTVVSPQQVRPGQSTHVKVELNALLAPQQGGPIQRVRRIAFIGYGEHVEAFVDNLSLVEE